MFILAGLASLALQAAAPPEAEGETGPHGDPNELTEQAIPQVDYEAAGRAAVADRLAVRPRTGPAKNVIIFIADGMDVTTTTAARILGGQREGRPGEENVLTFETLPHTALSKTYNVDAQVPDSAATATAILSGQKTRIGVLNVHQSVERGDCEGARENRLPTLADLAAGAGKAVGVVTTTRLTHATPAALYASSPDRDYESDADLPARSTCTDIARQLIERRDALNLKVAMGGGARAFTPNGKRKDGADLVAAWAEDGIAVTTPDGFVGLDPASDAPVLGLFADSHMDYEADRTDQPSLSEMTRFAIEKLSADEDGYLLLVEGGRVDHAHHAGNAARALIDVLAFDAAVATALERVNLDETLIIVTADHGHTLSFQGYPKRGNPVLGIVRSVGSDDHEIEMAADGRPYPTLAYANGPGANHLMKQGGPRPDLTDEQAQDVDYRQVSAVPSFSETHGGQDVVVYAAGPGAWLVGGVLEQNILYFVTEHAMKNGQNEANAP